MQFLADRTDVLSGVIQPCHRRTCDHDQVSHRAESIAQQIGHTLRENLADLIGGVRTHGQYGHRMLTECRVDRLRRRDDVSAGQDNGEAGDDDGGDRGSRIQMAARTNGQMARFNLPCLRENPGGVRNVDMRRIRNDRLDCSRSGLRPDFRRQRIERADESISLARHRLDIARCFSNIIERHPQLPDGRVQACVEVDNSLRPQSPDQLLARHQLTWVSQQLLQNLQRLILQANPAIPASQFANIGAKYPVVERDGLP